MKLKIKTVLDKHKATPYALWKITGLPRNTVYSIAQGKTLRLDLETLGKLLYGLEELTGKKFTPNDVLEVVR